ncbi:DUF418 domain-containing protein [Rhodococcus sp. NPDC058521]|uniref:DUF418 domain-containing protein n=1 Tax=Rhodococcus sp. NPDC058521 TaxID=3346536 RepID=UPI003662630A
MTDETAVRTANTSRVHDVDALRGFALLGIFVVNITFMASAYPGNLVDDPDFSAPLDDAARFLTSALFSMKFYLLFAFLFGYSFTMQMAAAHRTAASFVPRMLRRILGLFLLGVLNIVALYSGDVLTTYAVACLVLLAMYRVTDRVAIRVAVGLYALVSISLVSSSLFVDRSAFMPSHAQALSNAEEQTQTMLGSVGDVVGQHLDGLGLLALQAVSMQGPTALAMFLLGMVAGRRRLFAELNGQEPILRRVQFVGFPVGIAGGVAFAALGGDVDTTAVTVSVATAPFLAAAYVATLLRAMHSRRWGRLRRALSPAGKMALTNYLLQSVIGLLLFTGVGFGLAGTWGPAALLLAALVVFVAQMAGSSWWLSRHRYGPAEWILRWLTNWQRP